MGVMLPLVPGAGLMTQANESSTLPGLAGDQGLGINRMPEVFGVLPGQGQVSFPAVLNAGSSKP